MDEKCLPHGNTSPASERVWGLEKKDGRRWKHISRFSQKKEFKPFTGQPSKHFPSIPLPAQTALQQTPNYEFVSHPRKTFHFILCSTFIALNIYFKCINYNRHDRSKWCILWLPGLWWTDMTSRPYAHSNPKVSQGFGLIPNLQPTFIAIKIPPSCVQTAQNPNETQTPGEDKTLRFITVEIKIQYCNRANC